MNKTMNAALAWTTALFLSGPTGAVEPSRTEPVRLEWIVRAVAAQGQADRVEVRRESTAQVPAPGEPLELVSASAGVLTILRVTMDGAVTHAEHLLPAFDSRYPEVLVHPRSGAILMHGHARSVLQVVEWRRDGSLIERLYLSHPEIASLYQRQVNDSVQLLGDATDGYWALDRRNGTLLRIQPGDMTDRAEVTKLATAPDCCRAAAIGAERTLWLLGAGGVVQRIGPQGEVLARTQVNFDARGDRSFGDGRLFPAATGVALLSPDQTQLVLLDGQAQVRSRHALCAARPVGPATVAKPGGRPGDQAAEKPLSCAREAKRAGRLSAFAYAIGLADGRVLAGDGERMAVLSPDGGMRLLGGSSPCDSDLEALRRRPAGTTFQPCHDDSFRATALQRSEPGVPVSTWLLASPDDGLRHRYLLSWPESGGSATPASTPASNPSSGMTLGLPPPTGGLLQGLSSQARDLRTRLEDTFVDLRHGARPPNGWDETTVGRLIGAELYTRAVLSEGADHLPDREGQPGSVLRYLRRETSDFAVLDPRTVLVYTWSRGDSAFWRYDVATRRFDGQRLRLRPQPAACGGAMRAEPTSFESQLTNAWGGETLLLDNGRRQIGLITPDLKLSLLACLPAPIAQGLPRSGRSVWRIGAAARDLDGRWWLGMSDGSVLLQFGETFVPADFRSGTADDAVPGRQRQRLRGIVQLLPGPAGGMLVIAPGGIARLDRVGGAP
ncbi:hypothetical protein [Leptothrix discophora]|uniref:Uncharacterized protein n=1 Tax=Leptothrix discophora TaxID=89 RepID=A0ABT9G0P0_LEPDI|nr:hypothetical protein [Leptothrix discophora]MDP4300054.1 hypothetical protein [Leptothrix discophora]